ncbi:MAG TPA: hypothetical protein VD993_10525 [Chitinophagaceae bacterium]|nr:hypothetical protein [Chitinophagaceae bacterium]
MKQFIRNFGFKTFLLLLMVNVLPVLLMAQDTGGGQTTTTTTTSKTTSTEWYTSPWVWVAGAAVFILLLVALLRGGKRGDGATRTDKVTVTKSTRAESD